MLSLNFTFLWTMYFFKLCILKISKSCFFYKEKQIVTKIFNHFFKIIKWYAVPRVSIFWNWNLMITSPHSFLNLLTLQIMLACFVLYLKKLVWDLRGKMLFGISMKRVSFFDIVISSIVTSKYKSYILSYLK